MLFHGLSTGLVYKSYTKTTEHTLWQLASQSYQVNRHTSEILKYVTVTYKMHKVIHSVKLKRSFKYDVFA